MMIKEIPPRSFPSLDHLPQVELVKVAHDGLRGCDFADFVKRASHPQAMWIKANPPKPGEHYVHSHIFSFTDVGGLNRNADSYPREMARNDLHSYEKFGRAYLNHANTDPKKSFGIVKNAYANEPMGRAELIVALNGTKEAADRNGGLVAERTLKKLASNQDVAVSQSCKVPYDVCNSCGNKAKNRSEYCTGMTCKHGGCRDNLGRVSEDGHHLGVENPKCSFFDWSDVSDTRGADRTAFITGKVASSDRVLGGAELAERLGLVAPDYLLEPHVLSGLSAVRKLAAHTRAYPHSAPHWGAAVSVRAKIANVPVDAISSFYQNPHVELANLGSQGVILPPHSWLSAVTGTPVEKCAHVFAGGIDPSLLANHAEAADYLSQTVPVPQPTQHRHWLAPTPRAHGRETQLAELHKQAGTVKLSSSTPLYDDAPVHLAQEAKLRYLAYQSSILAAHQNSKDLLLLQNECVRHNQ